MKKPAGSSTAGMKTFHTNVWPATFVTIPGMIRREPSMKPMYQSGWELAESMAGLYGPYSQIGLIWATVAKVAITPKTKKNSAPVLTMNTGYSGSPTSLFSRCFFPGHCVWP